MLAMHLFAVFVGICCLATCAIALVPSGPSHQQAVIDGPPTVESPAVPEPLLETNIDDTDYWVHFKGDTHQDLSCKTNYAPDMSMYVDPAEERQIQPAEEDTVYLELHEKDPISYIWEKRRTSYLPDYLEYYYKLNSYTPPRTHRNDDEYGLKGGYSICHCHSWLAHTNLYLNTIGMDYNAIGLVDWGAPEIACQVYSNGTLMKIPEFSYLVSPREWIPRNYTWANVSNWKDIPRSAFMLSTDENLGICFNKSGLATGKRYIGRIISPGLDPVILDVSEGTDEAKILPPGYPINGTGIIRQVLVYHPNVPFKLKSLICQPATETLNLGQYREEVNLYVKTEPGHGRRGASEEEKREKALKEGAIFSKVSESASLVWKSARSQLLPFSPVLAGSDGTLPMLLCRFRCVYGETACMSLPYTTANGTFTVRSGDKTVGHYNLKTWLCEASLGGALLSTAHSDWLLNPCGVGVSWVPRTALSSSLGRLAVTQGNGETFAIARYSLPGKGDIVAQVRLDSKKKIVFSDKFSHDWESKIEKVDILVIHE